jgi:L-aspartate oxidase
VFLDITHKDSSFLQERFPNIYGTCKKYGVDITKQPIPVVPAAHYMCGGVQVDEWGVSSMQNLLAFGEVACTGLHGANRLASNSLLEAVVFAHRGADWLKKKWSGISAQKLPEVSGWRVGRARSIEENVLISHNWDQIRRLMWDYVGIVRREKRLKLVEKRIAPIIAETREHFHDYLLTPDLIELRNISVIAELIVRSATLRKESRGLHYIMDYPERDDQNFLHDTVLQKKVEVKR